MKKLSIPTLNKIIKTTFNNLKVGYIMSDCDDKCSSELSVIQKIENNIIILKCIESVNEHTKVNDVIEFKFNDNDECYIINPKLLYNADCYILPDGKIVYVGKMGHYDFEVKEVNSKYWNEFDSCKYRQCYQYSLFLETKNYLRFTTFGSTGSFIIYNSITNITRSQYKIISEYALSNNNRIMFNNTVYDFIENEMELQPIKGSISHIPIMFKIK